MSESGGPEPLRRLVRFFEYLIEAGHIVGSHVPGAVVLADAHAPASLEGVKRFLAMTPRGQEILKSLPASTRFKGYDRDPKSTTFAFYNRKTDTIHMPNGLTNIQAAVLASHEMLHADQFVNKGRGRALGSYRVEDLLLTEIQAFDAHLDVYEQLGKPTLPAPMDKEMNELLKLRATDRERFEMEIRITYRKKYDVH